MTDIKIQEQEIATTIIHQLGKHFTTMTGAKNFLYGTSEKTGNVFISFQFPLCKEANRCNIELTPDDTYHMRFGKYTAKTLDYKVTYELEGVYADMLQDVFTTYTGLDTYL